nr:2-C-methyl-D-erythritol 4-phosphate cytidylyltransferase [Actinomycetales bacterium]
MSTAVIITAAGSGSRLGHALPKALVPLGGRPILAWAVDGALASGVCDVLVVTAPPDLLDDVRALVPEGTVCVVGGETRQRSVANALAALPPDVEFVLVHDAARALTPPQVFREVVGALRNGCSAVVPAVPVTDTIKEAAEETDASGSVGSAGGAGSAAAGSAGAAGGTGTAHAGRELVSATVDRARLRAVQTPQGFERALLERAHATDGDSLTDDAGLVEALGEPVWLVPGADLALKITTPWDLALAEFLVTRPD